MSKRGEYLAATTPLGVAVFKEGVGYVRPGAEYVWVELGPRADLPDWHEQSKPYKLPFPTNEAALGFARAESERNPDRSVVIAYPDGRRWNGKAWIY